MKYLLPHVDHGRGPTQSIWRSGHGKIIPFFCSGARWFGFSGWNWQHTRHPLTYSATSCCMPGQYTTCLSVSYVALTPWYPAHGPSWACVSKIPLWPRGTTNFAAERGSGTYVRTPSCRCSMCLMELSVRSSEFRV